MQALRAEKAKENLILCVWLCILVQKGVQTIFHYLSWHERIHQMQNLKASEISGLIDRGRNLSTFFHFHTIQMQLVCNRVDVRREGSLPSLALPSLWEGKGQGEVRLIRNDHCLPYPFPSKRRAREQEGSFHINSSLQNRLQQNKCEMREIRISDSNSPHQHL